MRYLSFSAISVSHFTHKILSLEIVLSVKYFTANALIK